MRVCEMGSSACPMRKPVLAIVGIGLAALIFVPQAFAYTYISISVDPTYCNLAPLAGITSCNNNKGTVNSDSPAAQECVIWTYNGNYLSVHIKFYPYGIPTGSQPSGPLTTDKQCPYSGQDFSFKFNVTYIAQTCSAGTYPINFTATKGTYSNSTIFDANVKCVETPL